MELMEEEGPGPRVIRPRVIRPPSYDKARFFPAPQVPIHPLHRLNAELPQVPADESVDPAPPAAANPEAAAETSAD
jgi:hypothetical protein